MKENMHLSLLCAFFVCCCTGYYVHDDRFLSDVNLERYYILEENALSNADVLLRDDYFGADEGEDEEQHSEHAANLTELKSIIEETKAVHRLAALDLDTYLANPINIYHLISRLDNGWRQGINLMLESKPCKFWNLNSITELLSYLKRNLPGQREQLRVVNYIASLQTLYGLNAEDIATGKVGNIASVKPLDLEEQFNIARVFHEKEEAQLALQWMEHILKELEETNSTSLSFTMVDVMNFIASEYYHLGKVEEAKRMTEKVIDLDPANLVAEFNLKFFNYKLQALKDKGAGKKAPAKKLSDLERLCARKRKKVSRKTCKLLNYGILFFKMEIIRKKPYIVLFHDVIHNTTATHIRTFAHETLTDNAWQSGVKFQTPSFNVEVTDQMLRRQFARRHVRRLRRYLDTLILADSRQPQHIDNLQLINVGLEGSDLKKHLSKLHLVPKVMNKEISTPGSYLIFLNEVKTGGEVVFPKLGVKVHPEMGSVLFHQVSPSTTPSFCPAVASTLWVAVRPIHEQSQKICSPEDEWL